MYQPTKLRLPANRHQRATHQSWVHCRICYKYHREKNRAGYWGVILGGQIVVLNRVVRVGLIEEERFEGRLGSLPNISGRGDFQAEERARTKDPRREPSSHMTSVFEEEGGGQCGWCGPRERRSGSQGRKVNRSAWPEVKGFLAIVRT